MSEILDNVIELIRRGELLISSHGYDELASDGIYLKDIVESAYFAEELKDYPFYHRGHRGPCVLALQYDQAGNPVHVVWGIPKGKTSPAVLVTAYRPDPEIWTSDFRRKK